MESPSASSTRGDPYRAHCERTAALLAQQLGLAPDAMERVVPVALRRARAGCSPTPSRRWRRWHARGVKSLAVICPGFAADCLETLEEIGMENRDAFRAAGGEQYQYIAALNARPDHVAALRAVVLNEAAAARARPRRGSSRVLWLKAFHVVSVVSWFAALLYLPRLFVYHAQIQGASIDDPVGNARFKVMERKLFGIMTFAAVLAIGFGVAMLAVAPDYLLTRWLQLKLAPGAAADRLPRRLFRAAAAVRGRSQLARRALVPGVQRDSGAAARLES